MGQKVGHFPDGSRGGVETLFTVHCSLFTVHCSLSMRWGSVWCGAAGVTLVAGGRGGGCDVAEGGSVCVCVCVEVCVPFNVRSGLLVTVCILIDINLFYNALQLGRRWVVREDSDACGVAAELLTTLKFSGGEDAGKHACQDVEGGWAACKTLKSDLGF